MHLNQQLALLAPRQIATPQGVVAWREAGAASAPVLVLLHGIGSASASWVAQLAAAACGDLPWRVLAWDAPGYGGSEPLAPPAPCAADYALRLWAWLDALQIEAVALAGHSLGALMAAAACRQQPARVNRLTLLSPAQGYARAEAAVREDKLHSRLQALASLGPAGLAERRGAAMLSPCASAEQLGFIQAVMAQIQVHGYSQAARMLAGADLQAELQGLACPLTVASGSADTITPPPGCQALAAAVGAPYLSLGPVGHACPLEAATTVTALLGGTARPTHRTPHHVG